MSMSISTQTDGRRTYISGDTYPVREQLRAAGARWDASRKAWWLGDRARAEQLAASLALALALAPVAAQRNQAAATSSARTTQQRAAPRKPSPAAVAGEYTVSRPSRDRNDGYDVGECLYFSRVEEYGVVIQTGKSRNEDDEWECWARVRPATEEEIAPVRARREAAATKKSKVERLAAIHAEVLTHGYDGDAPEGRRVVTKRQPMGAESALLVAGDTVYARHPGYYDDYRVRTGLVADSVLAAEIIALADALGL